MYKNNLYYINIFNNVTYHFKIKIANKLNDSQYFPFWSIFYFINTVKKLVHTLSKGTKFILVII